MYKLFKFIVSLAFTTLLMITIYGVIVSYPSEVDGFVKKVVSQVEDGGSNLIQKIIPPKEKEVPIIFDVNQLHEYINNQMNQLEFNFAFECNYEINQCEEDTLNYLKQLKEQPINQVLIESFELKNNKVKQEIEISLQVKNESSLIKQENQNNGELPKLSDRRALDRYLYQQLNKKSEQIKFYCDYNFKQCLSDLKEDIFIVRDFIHPLYSYSSYQFKYIETKKYIELQVEYKLSDEEISLVQRKVDQIESSLPSTYSLEEQIKYYHDYIIQNASYEETCIDSKQCSEYSHSLYGILIKRSAVCEGYAEAMHLFLNELNLPNYRVASNTHAWNKVLYNNEWKYIDATFDDPISNGIVPASAKVRYFLIDYNQILINDCLDQENCTVNKENHIYDDTKYDRMYNALFVN